MWFDIALIVGGLIIVLAMMIFIINPPEAWVKKMFHRDPRQSNGKSKLPCYSATLIFYSTTNSASRLRMDSGASATTSQ